MTHQAVASAMDDLQEASSLVRCMDWQEERKEVKIRFRIKNRGRK